MCTQSDKVLSFWLKEVGPNDWHSPSDQIKQRMRDEFSDLWQLGNDGELGAWICGPETCLALILLLDQFPRLMFEGRPEAFGSDNVALSVGKRAIVMGHDMKVNEPERQFFYLPLMHSESLMDQERCVRLMTLRLPKCPPALIGHAKAHRDIIRQFGRFPCRNAYLGRSSTEPEQRYLDAGGYSYAARAFAA